jgi:hypothetical protein
LIQLFDKHLKRDKAIGQLYSKYFKKYYAGKPTKRYLRVLKQMKEGEGIRLEELLIS